MGSVLRRERIFRRFRPSVWIVSTAGQLEPAVHSSGKVRRAGCESMVTPQYAARRLRMEPLETHRRQNRTTSAVTPRRCRRSSDELNEARAVAGPGGGRRSTWPGTRSRGRFRRASGSLLLLESRYAVPRAFPRGGERQYDDGAPAAASSPALGGFRAGVRHRCGQRRHGEGWHRTFR